MNINYTYMRPAKAKMLKRMHEADFECRTNLKYTSHYNATILPSKRTTTLPFGLGGVVDEQGAYVEDSGIDYRFGGNYDYEESEYRNQRVVYCGYMVNHWGHFLVEGVARLWYCLQSDDEIDRYVFAGDLDGNTEVIGNYKQFFELLGIAEKLDIIHKPTRYKEVIVPELGYKRGTYYSKDYNSMFDIINRNALMIPIEKKYISKVYLSRRKFAESSEIGLDMLDDLFERNGFQILYPEKMTLTEMIHCLQHADVCVAESGTLPHNFLFAKKQKEVVIVERQDLINEIQIDIDKARELSVTYVDGYYTIYPTGKPYYLAYSECIKKYVEDMLMQPPNLKFLQDKYRKKCIRKYMRLYKGEHGYRWDVKRWELSYANIFYESYTDACTELGEYLSGDKIFMGLQLFEVRRWKIFVKKMLCKIRK